MRRLIPGPAQPLDSSIAGHPQAARRGNGSGGERPGQVRPSQKENLTDFRYFDKYTTMKPATPAARSPVPASSAHVEALKALSHLTRLQIFFFLVRARRGSPAGEIQEALKVPAPTLSHHLDKLRRAGLIQSRKESASLLLRQAEMVSDPRPLVDSLLLRKEAPQ